MVFGVLSVLSAMPKCHLVQETLSEARSIAQMKIRKQATAKVKSQQRSGPARGFLATSGLSNTSHSPPKRSVSLFCHCSVIATIALFLPIVPIARLDSVLPSKTSRKSRCLLHLCGGSVQKRAQFWTPFVAGSSVHTPQGLRFGQGHSKLHVGQVASCSKTRAMSSNVSYSKHCDERWWKMMKDDCSNCANCSKHFANFNSPPGCKLKFFYVPKNQHRLILSISTYSIEHATWHAQLIVKNFAYHLFKFHPVRCVQGIGM